MSKNNFRVETLGATTCLTFFLVNIFISIAKKCVAGKFAIIKCVVKSDNERMFSKRNVKFHCVM